MTKISGMAKVFSLIVILVGAIDCVDLAKIWLNLRNDCGDGFVGVEVHHYDKLRV